MTLDALAGERQFIDHLAPIWHALPDHVRGSFIVEPHLVDHAHALGIQPVAQERPLRVPAYPPPRFDGPLALVASYGDVKVGRRLGYGPFAFIEHGCGQTYNGDPRRQPRSGSYAGGGDREDNELILVPNQHSADAWRAAYPSAMVEIVGSPRLEALPKREPDRDFGECEHGPVGQCTAPYTDGVMPCSRFEFTRTVALSFHWDASSVSPEAGTALGEYLPILGELAKAEQYRIIGHAHPKGDWPRVCERYFRRAGIEFEPDFAEVCRRADLYVCDNSSTLFEFASTGRPVVVLNSKHYRKSIHHGLRFWATADVGMQVDDPGQLIATIDHALADPPEQQAARERALDVVYSHRSGGAQRAAQAIVAWLGQRAEQAA